MEHPKTALMTAVKEAMKNKDTFRRDTIRLVQSAIKQIEIDTREEVSADRALQIIQKEVKKRRDSVTELKQYGRAEQAEEIEQEITILESFLPAQLSADELREITQAAIEKVGAESMKDMGKVMGAVMPQVQGRADGNAVQTIVRELLS